MSNIASLASAKVAVIVALYNTAIEDYGVAAEPVKGFKSKAAALDAMTALCETGNLAVLEDNGEYTVIDATPQTPTVDDTNEGGEGGDDSDSEGGDDSADDSEGEGEGEGEATNAFVKASADWLAANPRGGADREAYRKARRKAARMARKAKTAALDEAITGE